MQTKTTPETEAWRATAAWQQLAAQRRPNRVPRIHAGSECDPFAGIAFWVAAGAAVWASLYFIFA